MHAKASSHHRSGYHLRPELTVGGEHIKKARLYRHPRFNWLPLWSETKQTGSGPAPQDSKGFGLPRGGSRSVRSWSLRQCSSDASSDRTPRTWLPDDCRSSRASRTRHSRSSRGRHRGHPREWLASGTSCRSSTKSALLSTEGEPLAAAAVCPLPVPRIARPSWTPCGNVRLR
jgi:hypothetical protein